MKPVLIHILNYCFDKDLDVAMVVGTGVWGIAAHVELALKIAIAIITVGYLSWKWRYEYKKSKQKTP